MTKEEYNEIPVYYCTKCMSLNIVKDKKYVMYCQDCGAGPKHLDVTFIDKYEKLFKKRMGHWPLTPEPTPYDDLKDVYDEETPSIMTTEEALANEHKVRDVINKNWKIKEKIKDVNDL